MQKVVIWSFMLLVGLAVGSAVLFALTARGGTWDGLLSIVQGRCTYFASGTHQGMIGGQPARSLADSLVRIPAGYAIIDHDIHVPRGTMLRESVIRKRRTAFRWRCSRRSAASGRQRSEHLRNRIYRRGGHALHSGGVQRGRFELSLTRAVLRHAVPQTHQIAGCGRRAPGQTATGCGRR